MEGLGGMGSAGLFGTRASTQDAVGRCDWTSQVTTAE